MIIALRSFLFMLVFYGVTIGVLLTAVPLALMAPRGIPALAYFWSRAHRWAAAVILRQTIRIEGTLPDGPYLYIVKHESMFETIDILCLLPHPAIAAKRELLDIPLWGWIARHYGLIPVERTAGAKALRALRAAAAEAIAAGRPVCIFPEGTRVPHGESPPLRAGFAGLYAVLRLPVVPIAIDSGRLAPRRRFLKRPGIITYKIGEIVPPGLDRQDAETRVHAAINALNIAAPQLA